MQQASTKDSKDIVLVFSENRVAECHGYDAMHNNHYGLTYLSIFDRSIAWYTI